MGPVSTWAVATTMPMPVAHSDRPATRMYLPPKRSDIRPANGAVNIDTSDIGANARPACSALSPSTICMACASGGPCPVKWCT